MDSLHARFIRDARAALADRDLQHLLGDVTGRFAVRRAASIDAEPEWETLRERARTIKHAALANLHRHLIDFEARVQAAGGCVYWASTIDEARQYVADLAARRGVTRLVKSKSMVSEELHLNEFLARHGLVSTETDFGEYIIQLAGEHPSHIIAPAIHKSRVEVGRLFAEKLGIPYSDDVGVLAAEARRRLRAEFAAAGIGVSGANFAVAETGTIVIVENEGNVRLATSMPPVHVVLVGIEKVIPRVEDLDVFLRILPRSGTGQQMTSYVSFITGPRRSGELDGPDELHVVLLDNGRSGILADPELREALQCIRCGACQNACPVYQNLGGHAYGGVYAGPIGAIVSSHLEPARVTPELPFVSTLCGACAVVCPVKIDIPRLLLHLREKAMRGRIPSAEVLVGRWRQRLALRAWAWVMRSPARYRRAGQLARWLMRRTSLLQRLPGPWRAWSAARELPVPARASFREMWETGELNGNGKGTHRG